MGGPNMEIWKASIGNSDIYFQWKITGLKTNKQLNIYSIITRETPSFSDYPSIIIIHGSNPSIPFYLRKKMAGADKPLFPILFTWGNDEGIALLELNALAIWHPVAQKDVSLFPWQQPILVQLQVVGCRGDEPEDLWVKKLQSVNSHWHDPVTRPELINRYKENWAFGLLPRQPLIHPWLSGLYSTIRYKIFKRQVWIALFQDQKDIS